MSDFLKAVFQNWIATQKVSDFVRLELLVLLGKAREWCRVEILLDNVSQLCEGNVGF